MSVNRNAIEECDTCGNRWFVWEQLSECPYCAIRQIQEHHRPVIDPKYKAFIVSGWVIMPGESATFRVTNENGYQRWERVLTAPPVEVKEDENDS